MIRTIKVSICTLITLLSVGCTTSVSKISKEGKVEEVVFPDIENAWRKAGTMPSQASVAKVRPGLPKDKMYALLGPPHFAEGFVGVREWDYIFTFKNFPQNKEDVCQFKIIYDPQMLVQETFWKPADCSQYATETVLPNPQIEKVIQREKDTILVSKVKISSDGLFKFGKYDIKDLQPGGKERLDKALSEILDTNDLVRVRVYGYTDRLGSDQYNLELSEARAETIKKYMISQGIPAEKIIASGLGKTAPLAKCDQQERNATLINCLQPNRRFEIEVETAKSELLRE